MKLYEYQAKKIFKDHNIPIPTGIVCSSENEVRNAFKIINKGDGVVLKAQVLAGGRGKAGGIKVAKTEEEAFEIFKQLLKKKIKDLNVYKVLVEERADILNEYYIGITLNTEASKPILLFSSKGGIDIEVIANESPEELYQKVINPVYGIYAYAICDAVKSLDISYKLSQQFVSIIKSLYEIYSTTDATLIEINPLVENHNGKLIAVDARLNIDENANFKQKKLQKLNDETENKTEMLLRKAGIYFVYLGGNVGLICAGAGMTMATMDIINAKGGKPACFCDVSAGINPESIEKTLKAVSELDGVKSILVNMFGGLTRMDQVAECFMIALKSLDDLTTPITFRLEGTNVLEGRKILKENGYKIYNNLYDAVEKAVELGA